ncbi:restriction endonuclease [Kitasatospora sp. GP82]|uniref:restriction endonuclease n=1 Tax=Kitasatospora sp. GP82 TaxID=3035089 RepID=UPI002474F354|nr:restriction endonuclease [Kitasatospora sp. GP82]
MKINRNQAVQPPVYADRGLRRTMGRRIAAATQDDLLAAFLRKEELHIVLRVLREAGRERELIAERQQETVGYICDPSTFEYEWKTAQSSFITLCQHLNGELEGARVAMERVEDEIFNLFEELFGGIGSALRNQYTEEARRSPALNRLGDLDAKIQEVRDQALANLKDFTDRIGERRELDQRRETFMASEAAISLDRIHTMDYAQFEQLAADLLERDGLTIVRQRGGARDQGADVIAETACGRRVVVQCKHRRAGAKVDPQTLHALNGTARQVHGADIVVAMTNRRFTYDAFTFGRDQDIHLITEPVLTRWATWGDPVHEILGLPAAEAPARDQPAVA